ncbi:MAG: ergothioneine biosynthesis protein EgtC [Propionibacteriaceae bacterium]
MCRHVAYLGPPRPLADLLFTPSHGLVHQSWAPREMRGGGTINADGFGLGWYPDADRAPVSYRQAGPIWSDPNLPGLATTITSGAVLGAVRSATVGMPVTAGAAAPFRDGPWLFSHNGVVRGWPEALATLAERLPITELLTLEAATDSALLWALVRQHLRAGAPLGEALSDTIRDVRREAPESRLNLLLTDGHRVAATTVGHSLWLRQGNGCLQIASEPLDDDPEWRPVPDGQLVLASTTHLDITELNT